MYITIETLKHLYKRKTISRFRWISLKISFWTWRYRSCKAEDDSAITWSDTIIHFDCDDVSLVVKYIHQENDDNYDDYDDNSDDYNDDNKDNNDEDNDDEIQCEP